jgi:hypothetical protein
MRRFPARLQSAMVAAWHRSVAARKSMVGDVDAYIANQSMLQMEDYLKRGRAFESVDDGALKSIWVGAFKDIAANFGGPFDWRRYYDVSAEFGVRGQEPPFDLVTSEIAALRAASRERVRKLDPAKIAKFNDDFDKFVQSGKEKPTN